MIEAELPDGTILEFPDGTSPDVMRSAVQRMGKPAQPSFAQQAKKELLSSLPVQLGLGAIRGAGSIGATAMRALPNFLGGDTSQENAERRQKMDQALTQFGADTDSFGFGAGKIGAEIAGTAGIGGGLARGATMLPGAAKAVPLIEALRTSGMSAGGAGLATRMAGAGATGAAAAGMVNPEDALAGGMISAAIPAVGKIAGAAGQSIGRAITPTTENIQAARTAQKYGIPIGAGDLLQSRTAKAAQSILRDAPLTGGMAAAAQDAKQEAFNRAVGSQFGAAEPKLTTQVIDSAKSRMGAEFDRIWNRNSLKVDPEMIQKMNALDSVAKKLPKQEGASLNAEIQDLFSRMTPDANGNLEIPGDVANKFQQYLRRRAEGSAGLKNELGDLRQTMIQAFNRSIPETDAAALTLNRSQYKAFKTVEPILRSAEVGIAGREAGDIPAALLPQAVNKSYSNLDTPLAELAQVGSKFLVDRTSQTGGSARAALQNTAIGAGLMGVGGLPAIAAAVPVGYGAQRLMQSPIMANRLMQPQNQALIESLRQTPSLVYRAAPVLAAQ